jgi:hypothetical protein
MNIRDYQTLHLDTNSSKRTALLLLFCISQSCMYCVQIINLYGDQHQIQTKIIMQL